MNAHATIGICSHCGHSHTQDEPVFIGDWCVDPSGVTTFCGQSIHLTKKENDILFVLAKARGRAVNNFAIEIRLGHDGESSIIPYHVLKVRRKMEAIAGFNMIETVHGRGYRWRT